MVTAVGVIALAVSIYSAANIGDEFEHHGYSFFFQILLMGVCGSFLTGDLFNLYVWFEVMLTASFALMVIGGKRMQLEGALKYVLINLLSSTFLVIGIGILYGITGTLNMADLAVKLKSVPQPAVVTLVSILFFLSFGIKAGTFPLFFWMPTSYHTPPTAVTALFAGMLTKVGVYAMLRMFTLVFVYNQTLTLITLSVVSVLSMVVGVFGALAQMNFRRLLAFHSISQIGYIIMGLGCFTPLAIAGSIFFVFHHMVVKTNLFLVSGFANALQGTFDLRKMGNLYHTFPVLGFLFLVSALSLGGIPPFSGFVGKLSLIRAGLEAEQYALVGFTVMVSLFTLLSMLKIWEHVFWKPRPETEQEDTPVLTLRQKVGYFVPIASLSLLAVVLGLAAQPVFAFSLKAAEQLMQPHHYIQAVLGAMP